jgi:hypothetical protein
MVEVIQMNPDFLRELIHFVTKPTDDPVLLAKQLAAIEGVVDHYPDLRAKLIEKGRDAGREEGRLIAARAMLRGVLAGRKLVIGPEEETAIAGCKDLATLERWRDQALTAEGVAEALR